MKRYKHIPMIITIVLVICVAFIATFVWDSFGADSQTAGQSVEPSKFALSDYKLQMEKNINGDSVEYLLSCVDEVLTQNEVVTLENNWCIDLYTDYHDGELSDYITVEKDTVTVNAAKYRANGGSQSVDFLLMLSFLTEEYEGCIGMLKYEWMPEINRPQDNALFICPGYAEAGYESAQAYADAWSDRECSQTCDAYRVGLRYETVRYLNESEGGDLFEKYVEKEST